VCANDVSAPTPVLPNVSNDTQTGNNCTLVNTLKTSNQFVLDSSKLQLLGNAGTVTLTFRNLTPGYFRIDGFQVIQGSTLTPGLYDDFLAGTGGLLNTSPTGWTLAPNTASKLATAYGGTQALAQGTGTAMTFDFQGTGFGVFTTVDTLGVDMRLCYQLKSNNQPFPASTVLNQVGTIASSNGITCQTFTTDTNTVITDWNTKNGVIPRPATATQVGFDIYGLAINTYTVEIRLVRPAAAVPPSLPVALAATDRLKIDAIAIFSDVEAGNPALQSAPSGQLYDNTNTGIRYEPSVFWKQVTTTTGPTTGPWNRTQTTTKNMGAIVQLNINGNGVIVYQTVGAASTTSRNVRVCLVTHLGLECTEYSQSPSATRYMSPIAFYGFGSGNHQIILDNRDAAHTFSMDGVRVLP
jgi:hypothetical protein